MGLMVLRMNNVGDKLLNGIKSMYVNILPCIRVKRSESKGFSIDRECETRLYHIPSFFSVYMDVVIKEVKMGLGRMKVRFLEKGKEWRFSGLLHADDLIFVKNCKST